MRRHPLTDPRGKTYTFQYDNHDKRVRTVFPGAGGAADIVQVTKHDNDGNVTCIYAFYAGNDPTAGSDGCPAAATSGMLDYLKYDYRRNGTGVRTSTKYAVTELGGKTTSYTYDALTRLKKAETRTAPNAAEELAGKAKEAVGDITGKDDLKAEGKADQAEAKTK